MNEPHRDSGALGRTPALERVLARLGRRLERLILAQGLGTLLAALCGWLVFAFIADWVLHVPRAVRWLHLGVLLAIPALVVLRTLVAPWRRRPDRAGLAILLERSHPGLHELLVSAVQLQGRASNTADADPELVAGVLAEAEQRVDSLSTEQVFDGRRPRLWLGTGVLAAVAVAAAGISRPTYASIFLDRLLGGSAAWPQRTHLVVSIPVAGPSDAGSPGAHLSVEAGLERIEVVVARGNDVPVLVRAEGRIPDEVTLHFDEGGDLAIASSGDGNFRTVLRSCQQETGFRVTGGDDRDGDPYVHVLVLDPPDVAGLAVAVEPPAYTGLPPSVRFDRDVEVLAGSTLTVIVRPDPPEARGRVRVLPEDRLLDLEPMRFPSAPAEPSASSASTVVGAEGEAPGAADETGLGFRLTPTESLRYRFELFDDSGLENPDPGLFAVHVVADRRPEVELLAPARGELDAVRGGMLRIVARAADDYGVAELAWRAGLSTREEVWGASQPLATSAVPPRMKGDATSERASVAGGVAVEVSALAEAAGAAPGSEPAEGDVYLVEALAHDNRPALPGVPAADGTTTPEVPDPDGVGRSSTVRVRVVSTDEFQRRLQERLARLRAKAGEAEELQREKAMRVRELVTALESDQPEGGARGSEIAAALAGQRRVQGDVEALARELAAVVEGVLYARVDDQAGALLEQLDRRLAGITAKGFDPAPWRELTGAAGVGDVTREGGGPGAGLARQLLAILEVALVASEDDAAVAAEAIDRAGNALEMEDVHRHLVQAGADQERTLTHLGELIDRLAEWDNYQSVLNLARDILNRQKSVRDRTKEALEGR